MSVKNIKSFYKSSSMRNGIFFFIIVLAGLSVVGVTDSDAQTTIISNLYSTTVNLGTSTNNILSNIVCVDLSYDLYHGLGDKGVDKSVINLQNYLYKTGYLRSTPNGYFGPSTLSAVKNYQLNNNIPNTGRVGPVTRKSIREKSCSVGNTASVINSIVTPTPNPKIESVNSTNLTITSPNASSSLVTDSKVVIRWNEVRDSSYSISLEDINGLAMGHIANMVFNNSHEWVVGKVYSAKLNKDIHVEPGIYRIKMANSRELKSIPDQYSGLFTILEKPLEIDSVVPSSVSNKDGSSVVLLGKGFDNTTMVNYDIGNNGYVVRPIFVSSNGKVLVFNVSSYINPGQYYLTVSNKFDNGTNSTPSNSVNLTIKE